MEHKVSEDRIWSTGRHNLVCKRGQFVSYKRHFTPDALPWHRKAPCGTVMQRNAYGNTSSVNASLCGHPIAMDPVIWQFIISKYQFSR